jgi:glucan phosphoethanolaminetransferase (alkaline phosphatase superfamily)
MGKLDEVKEILNTLRVLLSLLFGAIILLVGASVARLESNKYDLWTWISIAGIFFLLIALLMVFMMISKRTKEIKDL